MSLIWREYLIHKIPQWIVDVDVILLFLWRRLGIRFQSEAIPINNINVDISCDWWPNSKLNDFYANIFKNISSASLHSGNASTSVNIEILLCLLENWWYGLSELSSH